MMVIEDNPERSRWIWGLGANSILSTPLICTFPVFGRRGGEKVESTTTSSTMCADHNHRLVNFHDFRVPRSRCDISTHQPPRSSCDVTTHQRQILLNSSGYRRPPVPPPDGGH